MIRVTLAAIWFLLVLCVEAMAEKPHIHGVNVPDWYDSSCCNNKDCQPVDDINDIEPFMYGIAPAIRYKPANLIFPKSQFKKSQDERYHVCFSGRNTYCIYIPALT